MLGRVTDHMQVKERFRNDPTVRVEWLNAQTYQKVVILVANLLELIDTRLPLSGELHFDPFALDDPISL
jgi:hypothetical protein